MAEPTIIVPKKKSLLTDSTQDQADKRSVDSDDISSGSNNEAFLRYQLESAFARLEDQFKPVPWNDLDFAIASEKLYKIQNKYPDFNLNISQDLAPIIRELIDSGERLGLGVGMESKSPEKICTILGHVLAKIHEEPWNKSDSYPALPLQDGEIDLDFSNIKNLYDEDKNKAVRVILGNIRRYLVKLQNIKKSIITHSPSDITTGKIYNNLADIIVLAGVERADAEFFREEKIKEATEILNNKINKLDSIQENVKNKIPRIGEVVMTDSMGQIMAFGKDKDINLPIRRDIPASRWDVVDFKDLENGSKILKLVLFEEQSGGKIKKSDGLTGIIVIDSNNNISDKVIDEELGKVYRVPVSDSDVENRFLEIFSRYKQKIENDDIGFAKIEANIRSELLKANNREAVVDILKNYYPDDIEIAKKLAVFNGRQSHIDKEDFIKYLVEKWNEFSSKGFVGQPSLPIDFNLDKKIIDLELSHHIKYASDFAELDSVLYLFYPRDNDVSLDSVKKMIVDVQSSDDWLGAIPKEFGLRDKVRQLLAKEKLEKLRLSINRQ